ncbi:MAG: acyltransferase [Flavobacteriales bacterium]|nr:acyltransferase [Flavobacteriales bacterium]
MVQHERSRIFGLDLMRCIAVLLVVYSHADDLLDAYWPRDPGAAALDGVTVFFVLSGFLIGRMLLDMVLPSPIPLWKRVVDFWQRRWLRTLPNYYLFLVINIALVAWGWAPGLLNVNTLAYAVFLQNFIVPLDLFFWESWSLAVEEWFYLLFPLLLVLGVGLLKWRPHVGFLFATLGMILVPTILRFPAAEKVQTSFMLDLLVRKIVVMRLDSIGYGVLMAWCVREWPAWIRQQRVPLLLVGLVGLAATVFRSEYADLLYNGTWHCTFSALTLALMLPFLSAWRSFCWSVPVTFLSLVSYALYLAHMPLRNFFLEWVAGRSLPITVVIYASYYLASIGVAALVYRYWERPFMDRREALSKRLLRAT